MKLSKYYKPYIASKTSLIITKIKITTRVSTGTKMHPPPTPSTVLNADLRNPIMLPPPTPNETGGDSQFLQLSLLLLWILKITIKSLPLRVLFFECLIIL